MYIKWFFHERAYSKFFLYLFMLYLIHDSWNIAIRIQFTHYGNWNYILKILPIKLDTKYRQWNFNLKISPIKSQSKIGIANKVGYDISPMKSRLKNILVFFRRVPNARCTSTTLRLYTDNPLLLGNILQNSKPTCKQIL